MADIVNLGVEVQTKGAAQSAQQLGQFQNAAKGAAGAADNLEDQLRATSAAQSQVANSARPLAGAMQGVGQAFSRNTSAIQNASFQLQDIIVQMEMGVPASRVLGQQLPQLLGGFGALGAVVGLAVGALLTFAPALVGSADGAEKLKKAVDDLGDAVDAYAAASAAAASPTDKLIAQYGAASGAARELLQLNKELAQLAALDKLAASSDALVEAFGDFEGQTGDQLVATGQKAADLQARMADLQEQAKTAGDAQAGLLANRIMGLQMEIDALAGYTQGVERVQSALDSSQQEAITFAAALADLQNAMTLDEKIVAFERVKDLFNEITGGTKNMTVEQRALAQQMVKAALESLDLADGSSAAASNISVAASNATSLADEMGRAASNAISLAAQSFSTRAQAEIRLRFAGDPVGEARALATQRFDEQTRGIAGGPVGGETFATQRQIYIENAVAAAEAQQALQKFNETMKGGAASASDIEREAQRLYESTRTEAERYAAELDKVETLYRAGAISGEVYSRAIQDLNEKFDPLTKVMMGVASTVENELNSAFASVRKGTADLGDALLSFASNVLAKVAQDLFAQQFAAPISAGISGLFGGGAGAGGTGSLGLPKPFANGGVVSGATIFPFANGIGLMGEAGPEAIMPLARGADGKLGVVAANGNSAPKVVINNYSGQEATASSDSAGNIVVEIGRAIAQDITSGGPTYRAIRTTFGLGNRLQQRG